MMKKETVVVTTLIGLFVLSAILSLRGNLGQEGGGPLPSKNGIGVLYVYGEIGMSQTAPYLGFSGVDGLIQQVKDLGEDPKVKALILRVNSPGGTVGASQELYSQLIAFKEHTNLPVYTSIGDVGASGAYWIALASDKIYANPGSMVGSIGVVMNSFDFSKLGQTHGVKVNTIKSGRYKDIFSSWRAMEEDEKQLLSGVVEDVYDQFLDVFTASRKMTKAEAINLTDGRIFSGRQAKNAGLIDGLSGFEDVLAIAARDVGIKGKPVVINKARRSVQDFLHAWRVSSLASLKTNISSPFFTLK